MSTPPWSAPTKLCELPTYGRSCWRILCMGSASWPTARRRGRVGRVGEVHDARPEGIRGYELEAEGPSRVLEQPQPGSGGRRVDEEVQLVEEPGLEELAHDRWRPAEGDRTDRRVA